MIAGYVTPCNFSYNLCRNKIARQVARKIARCNTALSSLGFYYSFYIFLSDEETTPEMLDFAFYIGSTPTFYISICISALSTQHTTLISPFGEHGWRMQLAGCLSPLSLKLSLVGRGYSCMCDDLTSIAPC